MTMTMSVSLDDMKFGDLYDFVDVARRAGIPRDKEVATEVDGLDQEFGRDRLVVEVDNLDGGLAPDFDGLDRAHFIEVLDAVLATDGDARYALDEIKQLRDRLV
ncbi:hypothetical protein HZU40_11955 [Mycolicibacterium fluoranthenivorans]|uniref:Uncharacterized protein n=1 Tax=Mycolicibacterium fluoranthenivorans TaxID=258505 RepID=A0A7G8PKM2_9MYCO|nr:hypothetical protein [Mycolicibacterium fluoranthenivorans]QNJ94888.1 hypothetical protein HZU40_11955 [Mycolicibacterium fluoranthenivorans]